MLNLIRNENMKIYRRLRTWIMLGILLAIYTFVVIMMFYFGNGNQENWRQNYQQDIQSLQEQLQNKDLPNISKNELESQLLIKQYALEHDIEPVGNTLWGGVLDSVNLVQLITIFTVIVAGDIVASEFTWGTIKMLLIRPASRSKILLSKYLASFQYAFFQVVVLFVFAIILNGIFYGFGGIGEPHLVVNEAHTGVLEKSLFLSVLKSYGYALVSLVMIVTMAFMISSVFRSSALSIALSIVALLMGSVITGILAVYFNWSKYILFANLDLNQYAENRPMLEGMSMGFSITMLLIYFVLFNALSWGVFTKRDVAA